MGVWLCIEGSKIGITSLRSISKLTLSLSWNYFLSRLFKFVLPYINRRTLLNSRAAKGAVNFFTIKSVLVVTPIGKSISSLLSSWSNLNRGPGTQWTRPQSISQVSCVMIWVSIVLESSSWDFSRSALAWTCFSQDVVAEHLSLETSIFI